MSIQQQRPFAKPSRAHPGAQRPPALPRNARTIIDALVAGDMLPRASFVASFVDRTPFAEPHVFVDPGRRYDWRFAAGLHANIVTRPGIDARAVMEDLAGMAALGMAPYLIDFDSKVIATVFSGRPLALMPEPAGSYLWRQVFA